MRASDAAWSHLSSTARWAAPPLLLTAVLYMLQHTSSDVISHTAQHIFHRDNGGGCPVDLADPNACELVPKYCSDFDSDGFIPYARIYACASPSARPALLILMLLWLIVLFASMATAASDFLAVHLAFMVQRLHISESLAGVTILAFGNGCTDLFSTFAAMGANNGSLAISELFGAAAFITTVVLGLIVIIHPFSVDPRTLVGDVIWFIVAASSLVAFLADGQLVLSECIGIIGLYAAFVCFAIFRPRTQEPLVEHATDQGSSTDDATNESAQGTGRPDSDSEAISNSDQDNGNSFVRVGGADSPIDGPKLTAQHDYERDESDTYISDIGEQDDTNPLMDNESESIAPTATHDGVSILQNFPSIYRWHEQSTGERVLTAFSMPFLLPIVFTTPPCISEAGTAPAPQLDDYQDDRSMVGVRCDSTSRADRCRDWTQSTAMKLRRNWILCAQLILGPQFFGLVLVKLVIEASSPALTIASMLALLLSAIYLAYTLSSESKPGSGLSISILAFATSLTWIYLTATSAVSLLITLAWILNIPTSLLGATVFAVGQSSNDLFANTAIARRSMPVLAASATYGGPMMNMLLGIGGGGLVQALKPGANRGYTFHTEPGLFVGAGCLLLGLMVTLGWAFFNGWRLERRLGQVLIAIWTVSALVNVTLSIRA